MNFYTESGVDITQRIHDGQTTFFESSNRQEASQHARQRRSYLFDVFKILKNGNHVLVGYGVPK